MRKRKSRKLRAPAAARAAAPELPPWPERTRTNLLLLALLGAVLFRAVFLHPGQLMWANDIIRFTLPGRFAEWRALWEYHCPPLWDPTILCGMSAAGDQARGLTNPLSWLHWLLPAPSLFGPLSCLVAVLGAWGMFLFMRERGTNATGSFLAAAAFALSGKTAGHLFAGHLYLVSTALGLPWMLYGVERVVRRKDIRSVVVMAALFACVAVQGAVQIYYWNILFAALYTTIRLGLEKESGRHAGRDCLRLGAGAALGALLCAPWWVPVIRQTLLLGARSQDSSYEFASMASAAPLDLARFLWPFAGVPMPEAFADDARMSFFWESASYPGVVAVALAVTGVFVHARSRFVWALVLVGLAALLVGLGPHTPLHNLAYHAVPGFSFFRAPARLFFYVNFIVAMLAGGMLGRDGSPRDAGWSLGVAVVLFQAVFFAALGLNNTGAAPQAGLWIPVAVTGTLAVPAFFWTIGKISARPFHYACLGAIAAELVCVWTPHVRTVPARQIFPENPTAAFLASARNVEPFRVLDTTGTLPQHIAAKYGLEMVDGYHPGIYGHQLDLYHRIWREDSSSIVELQPHRAGEIACPVILDLMNVQYLVAYDALPGEGYEEVHRAPGGADRPAIRTYRRTPSLPRAYLAAGTQTPPEGQSVLDALCTAKLREHALVGSGAAAGNGSFQAARVVEEGPGRMVLDFTAQEGGVLVLSHSWHPDWRAHDNGNPAPVLRVNHGQLGVRVSAGRHRIELKYVPRDLYLGAVLSGGTLVLLAIGAAGRRRLERWFPGRRGRA